MIRDYFNFAVRDFKNRKLRNLLTLSGIIIGIASIVALLLISEGLQNAINEQFEQIGSNRVYVYPKSGSSAAFASFQGLKDTDVEALGAISEIEWVNPGLYVQSAKVEFNDEILFLPVIGLQTEGLDKKWNDVGFGVVDGRMFSGGEKYDVIIGDMVAHDLFDKDIGVRESLFIKDKKFKVMGVMDEIGNSQDDSSLYLSIDLVEEMFDRQNEVSYIEIKVKTGQDINVVAEKITDTLKRKRGNENFEVMTPEQFMRQLDTILGVVKFVLAGIAAISLLVGAVGIMNSLYASVLEKTREIGVMKAIGARNGDILSMFLIKAGLIGSVGGLIGALLGTGIGLMVNIVAEASGFSLLKVEPSLTLILMGMFFAAIVAMISGYFPAKKAAKLRPVEALQYG